MLFDNLILLLKRKKFIFFTCLLLHHGKFFMKCPHEQLSGDFSKKKLGYIKLFELFVFFRKQNIYFSAKQSYLHFKVPDLFPWQRPR